MATMLLCTLSHMPARECTYLTPAYAGRPGDDRIINMELPSEGIHFMKSNRLPDGCSLLHIRTTALCFYHAGIGQERALRQFATIACCCPSAGERPRAYSNRATVESSR